MRSSDLVPEKLGRIRRLLEKLGNPQRGLRFVHVAGTNGKGSTCAFLSTILREAGYCTGLFTSPYVFEINERIAVDGQNISDIDLASKRKTVKEAAAALGEVPTGFELMVAVAFLYFAEMDCDIVVCEAGLGGRRDATNVIEQPEVSLIALIGMDHQEVLGDTLELIAQEKAGIIKRGVPVVSWPQEAPAQEILVQTAGSMGAAFSSPNFTQLKIEAFDPDKQASQEKVRRFSYKELENLQIAFLPAYQVRNAVLAIEAVYVLRAQGWNISERALRVGLEQASWPGRFEVLSTDPLIIIDGAHNLPAVQGLLLTLDELFSGMEPIFVIGFLKDKDYESMLAQVLRAGSAFFIFEPDDPRALPAGELADTVRKLWAKAHPNDRSFMLKTAPCAQEALSMACEYADQNRLICAFGSIYSIADLTRTSKQQS